MTTFEASNGHIITNHNNMCRPLNPDKPYYSWKVDNGELTIYSECCAGKATFSAEELEELRKVLNEL